MYDLKVSHCSGDLTHSVLSFPGFIFYTEVLKGETAFHDGRTWLPLLMDCLTELQLQNFRDSSLLPSLSHPSLTRLREQPAPMGWPYVKGRNQENTCDSKDREKMNSRLMAARVLISAFWVLLFSHVWFFSTPWTAACQASLSFTISQSLFKLMSIE